MKAYVQRHRAAIRRRDLSRPVRGALADGVLDAGRTFFDFGCGHGDDLRMLAARGLEVDGWDPVHRPASLRRPADVVNLGFVVNVVEDRDEREETLREAWSLARQVLVVAARTEADGRETGGERYEDGILTRLGTFQKFFDHAELGAWIETVLGTAPLAAAPGVFYVFRDEHLREQVAASRVRRAPTHARATPDALFRAHEEVLQPLVDFLNVRGRLPAPEELPETQDIVERLGSVRRAFGIVRRAIGEESWASVELLRTEDLLVYLALARFRRRPPYGALPRELQLDVRAFFKSYDRACELADEVLLAAGNLELIDRACRTSPVGKLTPSALYLHESAVPHAPPLLRVYEGCARGYVGVVDKANVIKLNRRVPQVSYLSYPTFDTDPHPELAMAVTVPLQTFRVEVRDYRPSKNPPLLHRKECFVAPDYPLREKFARLTAQEERADLYAQPKAIGTREGWAEEVRRRGLRFAGHRLVRE